MKTKQCITCNKTITKAKWEGITRWNNRKYCSLQCRQAWNKGLTKKDPRVQSYINKSKSTQFTSDNMKGDKNTNWKGDNASYYAKHMWVNNNFGKPKICEQCKTTEDVMYHWANISGKHIRNRRDWLRLCVPCHRKYDFDRQKNWNKYKTNTSGYRGVTYAKHVKMWRAQINIDKKRKHLGYYKTPEEAGEAYIKAIKARYKT